MSPRLILSTVPNSAASFKAYPADVTSPPIDRSPLTVKSFPIVTLFGSPIVAEDPSPGV